ncbi:hypothetical protein [Nonomuraea rubra]|uniref:hypothetical protein n=1 Tax=Nonomuraea rubra TaxID=46180 RepID=UPI0033D29D36
MPKPEHPRTPDVEISASAKAKELRFHERPEVSVDAEAEPGGECAWGSDRTNLPGQVEPNVTYRDLRIDFRVAAALTDPALTDPADSEQATDPEQATGPEQVTGPAEEPPSP